MTHDIVIDLFDRAEELDVIGPFEVLASWTQQYPEDGWQVYLVSDDGLPRRGAKGLTLTPKCRRDEVPHPDVDIEPGGQGTRARLAHPDHLDWLRATAGNGAVVTSVCTGALVLAAAGLLHGRPATTDHAALDEIIAIDPTIVPRPHSRWVDDGQLITAGGVSAGIDMALHLVGRLAGTARGRRVQDDVEYHPAPPAWGAAASNGQAR